MRERVREKNGSEIKNEGGRVEIIAKYFLLTMLLSFFGWAFETGFTYLSTGKFYDRGFLTMPFCPIYGCSLMLVYFLLGTPNEGRGILKNVRDPFARYSLYFVFAFLIPTAAELLVGFVFDVFFDTWLWSYSSLPFNFRGYISLPISIGWAVLVFLFMGCVFKPLKRLVFKIPKLFAVPLAFALAIAVAVDLVLSYRAL